jgi:hypothetical protein
MKKPPEPAYPPGPAYPDISDILRRKAEAREERARLPYGEKIAIVEALRERLAPFKEAREANAAGARQEGMSQHK